MLRRSIFRVRFWSAIALAALYAVCVVSPSVALAFTNGYAPSHCLTGDHPRMSDARLRDDIRIHHGINALSDGAIDNQANNPVDDGGGKLKCHADACCGSLCFAAIIGDFARTLGQPVLAAALFEALDERLDGRKPKCIARPPKPFLSL